MCMHQKALNKAIIIVLLIPALFAPFDVLAFECEKSGYTIVFVNGVLNSEFKGQQSAKSLDNKLKENFKGENVTVRLGYNASHFAGLGDFVQAISQAFGSPISDYDLQTILMQIHPEVRTQKILLVGHSQGTFYTNDMYEYLVKNGVPRESIGVYNLATPASYVAGGGSYLTSSNDKLINAVRDTEVQGNKRAHVDTYGVINRGIVSSALRANIEIPKEPGWEESSFGGHNFIDAYLAGASDRIVADIERSLARLKAVPGSAADGCFTPPDADLLYKTKDALYSILDPAVNTAVQQRDQVAAAMHTVTGNAFSGLATIGKFFAGLGARGQTASAAEPLSTPADQRVAPASETRPIAPDPEPVAAPATAPVAVEPMQDAPVQPMRIEATAPQTEPVPPAPTPPITPSAPQQVLVPIEAGFGGGGVSAASETEAQSESEAEPVRVTPLAVTSPADGAILATTTLTLTGTSDANALITVTLDATIATTTADGAGNWTLAVVATEGDAALAIDASNGTDANAVTVTRTVTIDTTPPAAPAVSAAACNSSIVAASCVLPVLAVTIDWDVIADASMYRVAANGVWGDAMTATSTTVSLIDAATTTIEIVAYDAAGNAATSTALAIVGLDDTLVVNEIAWGGSETADEQWIELENRTEYSIDLSRFEITRSGDAAIALTGTLMPAPNNHAVVTPVDLDAYTGLHEVVSAFDALSVSGEQLAVTWEGEVLDQTPAVETCGGWCTGSANAKLGSNASGRNDLYTPLSMERISGTADGTLAASWQDTDAYGPWLGGGELWGTPGNDNSNGYPESGVACEGNSFVVEDGPYNPAGWCLYLSKFITTGFSGEGVNRYGALYRGTVGSSTIVTGHSFGKSTAASGFVDVPDDVTAGEPFFFLVYENRSFGFDNANFNGYVTVGYAPTPPHGNYVIIPFTYQP